MFTNLIIKLKKNHPTPTHCAQKGTTKSIRRKPKKRQTTNKHDDSLWLSRYIYFLTNDLENFGKPVRCAVMQLYQLGLVRSFVRSPSLMYRFDSHSYTFIISYVLPYSVIYFHVRVSFIRYVKLRATEPHWYDTSYTGMEFRWSNLIYGIFFYTFAVISLIFTLIFFASFYVMACLLSLISN